MRIISVALLVALPTFAGVINFDSTATGTVLSNQFVGQGVVFQSTGSVPGSDSFFEVRAQSEFGVTITPSLPNFANVRMDGAGNTAILSFLGITNSVSFDLVGLNSSGGYFDGATVSIFDSEGGLLGSTVVAPKGPLASFAVGNVSFSNAGIHEVRFQQILNASGNGLFGIDNLTFGDVTSTPEPTSALLLFGGLAAGLFSRRLRK